MVGMDILTNLMVIPLNIIILMLDLFTIITTNAPVFSCKDIVRFLSWDGKLESWLVVLGFLLTLLSNCHNFDFKFQLIHADKPKILHLLCYNFYKVYIAIIIFICFFIGLIVHQYQAMSSSSWVCRNLPPFCHTIIYHYFCY